MSEFDLHTLAGDVDGTVGAGPRHTHERVVVGAFGVRQHRGQFVVVEREHRGQRGDATTGAHTFGLVDPDLEARFCTHGEQGSGMTLAVVTGAARGLGAAIADRLAQQGYDVARLDVLPGPNVIECDVADRVAVEEVAAGLGPVDVLVNNAGIWRFSALEDVDPIDFDRVLAVNLGGTFHCTQVFGRSMLAAGRGAIVNMVSIAAAAANPPDQPAAPRPQQKQEQQPEQQQEHGGKRVAEAEEEGFWAPEHLQPGGEAEEQRSQGRGEAGSDLEQQEQCHPNSQPQQQPAAGMCATTIAITAALGEGWEAEAVAAGDDDW